MNDLPFDVLRNYFESHEDLPVAAAWLFGSQASNEATASSDVDVAILLDHPDSLSDFEIIDIRDELGDTLGRSVDLVALNKAGPILGRQVVSTGKEILVRRPRAYYDYLIRLFTEYADLKRVRKPMEENILERRYFDGPGSAPSQD